MVAMSQKKAVLGDSPAKANLVFREIVDFNGVKINTLFARYDGTIEDAIRKAKNLSDLMFANFPQASNMNSQIGAYDENGKARWIISPNFKNIEEIASKDAFLWGGLLAAANGYLQ